MYITFIQIFTHIGIYSSPTHCHITRLPLSFPMASKRLLNETKTFVFSLLVGHSERLKIPFSRC